jgi:hypothetical protein
MSQRAGALAVGALGQAVPNRKFASFASRNLPASMLDLSGSHIWQVELEPGTESLRIMRDAIAGGLCFIGN